MRDFIIIGGDKRQVYLKNILTDKGFRVCHIMYTDDISELGNTGNYSDVILPIPLSKDSVNLYSINGLDIELESLYGKIKPYQRVYGCNIREDISEHIFDFMKDKTFKLINAYLTAQGTLRLMLENTESYIIGKKVLIIGFGDVASTLSDMLSKLGLRVTIAMRNQYKGLTAKTSGYDVINFEDITKSIDDFDYIIGTVPYTILTHEQISRMNNKSIYIELASAPFTANKSSFEKYSKTYIYGGALPGRYLPLSSAELMADFILNSH